MLAAATKAPTQTPLTEDEQARVVELVPLAERIARKYGDDEYESVALTSLCKAVIDFRTKSAKWTGTLRDFVRLAISRDLKDFQRAEARRRSVASIDDLLDAAEHFQEVLELPRNEAEERALEIFREAILARFGRRPTLRDVAKWMGCHPNTLARLRQKGKAVQEP